MNVDMNAVESIISEQGYEIEKILEENRKKIAELQKTITEKSKVVLEKAFVDVFKKHPQLVAFAWTQYTPYFNDGDTCEFEVNDLQYTLSQEEFENKEHYEWNCASYGHVPKAPDSYTREKAKNGDSYYSRQVKAYEEYTANATPEMIVADTALVEDMKAIEKFIMSLDENMKALFGDHVLITVTNKGIDVEEYEHD